ncbi:MAG TPA: arginine--tRNA ligase [Clostridiales bacterium]|nr:arginine--tRNA ligase [Clostridiales bacterium]
MQTIKKRIAEQVLAGVRKVNPDTALTAGEIAGMLEYPPDPAMGDLAFPCFKLSRELRRSPIQIASALKEDLADEAIGSVEVAGGYLNIRIANAYLGGTVVPEILEKGEQYGAQTFGCGKKVVLDYSSPNVAKPFHIGHLGTTVIGHSLRKLHEFAGYECYGINYLGDWGTQFGKLIAAYHRWGSREMIEKGGIDKLVELYVRVNNEIKGDPEHGLPANTALADEARAEFHKLETGDEENLALWRWFVQISLAEYEKTYKQLGITFDSYRGESFYTDKMPAQIEILREKGLLKLDDGASIVDLSEYNMPPCLILKRDGSTLYPTRDIAAAVYRKETLHFDKMIYVTSAQQCLHFAQWFKVVELMGYPWYNELVHVPYGTVSLNGEKLATRTGNVVLLRDLFALAIDKVKGIMKEKNPDRQDDDATAEAVGVGAVVFYYLSNTRMKDINFVMDEALNFDGNTGPYVQYTYARACSVLERGGAVTAGPMTVTTDEEAALIKTLCRYGERVTAAIADYEPSYITRFILDVAAGFNRFYHNCRILSAEDPAVRESRLRLTAAVKNVLGSAFELICLKKTEKV